MARRMASNFGNIDGVHIHGPGCGHCEETDGSNAGGQSGQESGSGTGVATEPDNYNNTKTEIISIHGRQFLKKTTVIKKGGPGTSIFISSTTYEPINDSDNTDNGNEGDLKPSGSNGGDNGSSIAPSSTESTSSVPMQPKPEVEDGEPDQGSVSSPSSTSSTSTTTESGLEREELTSPTTPAVVPV